MAPDGVVQRLKKALKPISLSGHAFQLLDERRVRPVGILVAERLDQLLQIRDAVLRLDARGALGASVELSLPDPLRRQGRGRLTLGDGILGDGFIV